MLTYGYFIWLYSDIIKEGNGSNIYYEGLFPDKRTFYEIIINIDIALYHALLKVLLHKTNDILLAREKK